MKDYMKEKLRIGILLHDFVIPSWESQVIRNISNSDFSEIVLVIKDNSTDSKAQTDNRGIAHRLIRLIEKTDRLIFKTHSDYKLKTDISAIFSNTRTVEINTSQAEGNFTQGTSFLSQIKDLELDIILSVGCCSPTDDILKLSEYGLWSYTFDACGEADIPSPGFWEVIRNIPVTNSTLEILSAEKAKAAVIFSSYESTCRYSMNINRNSVAWRSALFAPRIMHGLNRYGEPYLNTLINRFSLTGNVTQRSFPRISLSVAAGTLLRYTVSVMKSIVKKLLFTDAFRWRLLFDINEGGQLPSAAYGNFRKLLSPEGIFWADPFVVAGDDCYWIFVEEFVYKKDRAHLSVLKLDKKGNLIDNHKIIERPYHMSYPFIFKIKDSYYMIPETSKNKTIELYKCVDFPYRWEFERNIMENISAVDSTLFRFNNKWWLFTAIDQTANISGCSAELFLYYTDDLFSGLWISHPLNPVVSDIRTARPAGNLFVSDGKIYRPSQNCSGRYGIGFNINHIAKLTENEYEETLISEVKPVWDKKLKGTHTLNFDTGFTIIDAYSYRSRLSI